MVKFKLLDTTGFSVHEKPAVEALEYMKTYLQQKGGFFYLDKVVTDINTITPKDLEDATLITVTNVVIGGVLFDTDISSLC